jgi:hypothetical protein
MQINYDSTNIDLDKRIFDSEIEIQRLKNNLVALKKNTNLNLSEAKDDVENANYANLDSRSALDVQKIDNTISKAELDYSNVLANNKESIDSFKSNFSTQYNSLNSLIIDINDFSDKLFNFTGIYEDQVKPIKDFLG